MLACLYKCNKKCDCLSKSPLLSNIVPLCASKCLRWEDRGRERVLWAVFVLVTVCMFGEGVKSLRANSETAVELSGSHRGWKEGRKNKKNNTIKSSCMDICSRAFLFALFWNTSHVCGICSSVWKKLWIIIKYLQLVSGWSWGISNLGVMFSEPLLNQHKVIPVTALRGCLIEKCWWYVWRRHEIFRN